jgi:hypothetical protein
MITCGGQATIPMVAAVSRATPVSYAEIVASVASLSAGPGTRQNIDEFTQTTSKGVETIGGAAQGKEDYADGTSGGAEQTVIGLDYTIGVREQVLGVLLSLFAERGIDVYGNPAARTGSNQV